MHNRTKSGLALALALAWTAATYAAEPAPLKDEEKLSYLVGADVGTNLRTQGIEISVEPFLRGLKDALEEKELAIPEEEIEQIVTSARQKAREKMLADHAAAAQKNETEGSAFLAENKAKEGVTTTASGLQYSVEKMGSGAKPTASDTVRVHYRGTLLNGKEFDSSYKRNEPAEFPVNGVIPGWTEALQLMPVGSKWKLYVPAALAYGEQGRPGIPPNATLLFDVELLEIVSGTKSINLNPAPQGSK